MKFSKATYLVFAVFFLMTKIGVAFNVHYCLGSVANITHIFQHNEGCGMEMMNDHSDMKMSKKSCCSDEVITIQNNDKNPLVDKLELSKNQLLAVLSTAILFHLVELPLQYNIIEVEYENSSHSPPLYKLYCNYILYA
jgi:hypothetical protein